MYRRTGGQPQPSILICPNCQKPKDTAQSTCPNCNTRSCPNGHILSTNAAICSKCGWQDHGWKPSSRSFTEPAAPGVPAAGGGFTPVDRCPICGARLDPKFSNCPSCGNLVNTGFDLEQEHINIPPGPQISTPASVQSHIESYTVRQETIGHHDAKRTYFCPRCQSKIDDPTAGHCSNCGFVGTMQYDLTEHQPKWAMPQAPQAPPIQMRQQSMPAQKPPAAKFTEESACPSCGAPNPADSRFCRTCGTRYGSGRISHQVRTMSTSEWSSTAVNQLPTILEPIYQGAGEGPAGAAEIPMRGGREKPPGKKGGKNRVTTYEEKKFPLGLLMAIMIVLALIIAVGIFVISKEFRSTPTTVSTDTTPPVITKVNVNTISDTTAEVSWVTDEPASSQIMLCDPEGVCTWTEPDNALVTDHTVNLSNLNQTINYHLTMKSIDAHGNEASFERDQTFTGGTSETDTVPPAITDVNYTELTDMGVVINWKTDEAATSQVEYGTTNSYGSATTLDSSLVTSHSVTVIGLDAGKLYYYKILSKDADGNEKAYSGTDTMFTTLQAITIGLQKGNRAPDFELEDVNGNKVKLSSFRGKKIVLINFWYTTCTPCVQEMPHIQTVYSTWAGEKPLEVLAVNIMDTRNTVQGWMQGKNYTFPLLLGTSIKNQYSITEAPTTYILDLQGIIKAVEHQFTSPEQIEAILNSL